ncbi:DUF6538 domain-containing protein [Kangiella sp. TOML190]|uniref:DUF6538 domain-containing protein n=1 Tax=Kangiella sp. TOML190 TaxID=2931351 RepID=UPI0035E1DE66
MKGNKYLVKRGNKFYLRMPLSKELSLVLGRNEIKRSLKTTDKPRAILKGSLYYYFTKKCSGLDKQLNNQRDRKGSSVASCC